MNEEYELKLSLSPENLERLGRSSLIRSLAARRSRRKQLVSTYFDTPSQSLRRQGMALRVRQVGKKRIQTLKASAGQASGLQHYREYEAEIGQDEPDLSLIEDPEIQAIFVREELAENLGPVFATRFARRTILLKVEDNEIELALDVGEIEAGARRMPISEAEFELIAGRPTSLYELALAVNETLPFHLERRTKAARGYGLSEGTVSRPTKAKAIQLDPQMTAAEAFAAAVGSCLAQIRANEPVVLNDDDPEGVHQLRVGVRRLRAVVGAFRKAIDTSVFGFLREELRWLQRRLGPAREWDVFIHETVDPLQERLQERSPGRSNLAALREAALAAQETGYREARETLMAGRYTALMLRLSLWLDEGRWMPPADGGKADPRAKSAADFAAQILAERDRKLRKLAGKSRELREEELHEVRIRAKQMRYSAEFFRTLFPEREVKRQLGALEAIQDALGSLNDAVVGRQLLKDLGDACGSPAAAKRIGAAAALVEGWQAACIARDLKHFDESWARYRRAARYWRA